MTKEEINEQNLVSDLINNKDIDSGLSKDVFNNLNDQYLQDEYNKIRNLEYLESARKDFNYHKIDIQVMCLKVKSNLDIRNFIGMYLTAISAKTLSWTELSSANKENEYQHCSRGQ